MIPLSDGIAARRFPIVNVALIAANFAVFLFYELPNPDSAVSQAALYPCDVTSACHIGGLPLGLGWITAMFMHSGWDHILGNILFLAIFGKMPKMRSAVSAICASTSPADSPLR